MRAQSIGRAIGVVLTVLSAERRSDAPAAGDEHHPVGAANALPRCLRMIDVKQVDRVRDGIRRYESGTPITFCLFDQRVLLPLSQVADMVADGTGRRRA